MKNGYGQEIRWVLEGQEIRWVLEKDMLAYLKETQTPEKYAEFEDRHKELHERIRERSAALQAKNAPQ
jgi:DNA-binding GntR family transcriptional regulator